MNTELALKNISTNHLLDDAKYTLKNSYRTATGQIEGIALKESNTIFKYLGKKFYLSGTILTNDKGLIITEQYNRHFEKDGSLFIESKNNSLYKLIDKAIITQYHKYGLLDGKIYYASVCKNNISFLGTNNEITYINALGQIFYINFQDGYYWTTNIEGKKKDKFDFDLLLPITQKTFFLLAPRGIEFIIQKDSTVFHYQIIESIITTLNQFDSLATLLEAQYVDNKLRLVFKKADSIYYQYLGEEQKTEVFNSTIESIQEILNEAINDKEYQKTYNKIIVVPNGIASISDLMGSTTNIKKYKEQHSTEILNNFEIFTTNESSICKIENNNIVIYTEIFLTLKEISYNLINNTKRYCTGTKTEYRPGSGNGVGNNAGTWVTSFTYGNLRTFSYTRSQEEERKIIISVVSVFNTEKNNFEAINIHFQRMPIKEFNPYGYANISKNAITIDYEIYIADEEDETDKEDEKEEIKEAQNRLLLTNFNYPLEKDILSYINNNVTGKLILDLEEKIIGQDYKQGQEQFSHGSNFIVEETALEFMQGNVYLNTYHNLTIKFYLNKNILPPFEGEQPLLYIAQELNPNYDSDDGEQDKYITLWTMQSPLIHYVKNMSLFIPTGSTHFKLQVSPIKKIHKYSTGGEHVFIVYENEKKTIQIQNFSKKSANEFISLDNDITELEATAGGTYIATKNSLRFLRAIATGQGIEQYLDTLQLDTDVISIGKELLFFYGEGIIYYIRDNNIKKIEWKIKAVPLKAMKKESYFMIQTEDNLLWLLSPNTGEISLLSKSENSDNSDNILDYQIKLNNKPYYIIKSNPVFSFSWSQQRLKNIRKISSFSEIIKATIENKESKIMKQNDLYFANMRGLLTRDSFVEISFNKKIGNNIIIETN